MDFKVFRNFLIKPLKNIKMETPNKDTSLTTQKKEKKKERKKNQFVVKAIHSI